MGETRTRVVEGREAKLVGAKVESKAASSIRRKFRKEGEAAHGKEKSGGGGGGVWSTGRNSKCVCVLRKVLRNPPVSSSPTQFPSNLLVGSERALGLGSKKWETLLSREGVSRTPVSRRCLSKTESSAATTTSCSTRPTPTSLTAISGSSSSFPASHEAGRGSPTLCMPMSPTIATGTSTTSRSNPSDPPLESERVPHMQTFQLSA